MKNFQYLRILSYVRRIAGIVALLQLMIVAVPGANSTAWAQSGSLADNTLLQPGDELIIMLPERGASSERTVVVDLDGTVGLGIYGRVRLSGMTVDSALRELKAHLSEYIRATDGVFLTLSRHQMLVFVTGQVATPGLTIVPPSADVWTAIRSAGGVLEGSDLGGTVIVREGNEIIVDLQAYLTRESVEPLPQLFGGDTIFVPAQPGLPTADSGAGAFLGSEVLRSKVFVIGAVNSPGIYERSSNLTPLAALAVADGPTESAELSGARIVTAEGSRPVDLAGILSGEIPDSSDFFSDSGAILFIPNRMEGASSRFVDGIAVMGAVTTPGNIEIGGPVPISEALSLAGGPSPEARLRRVSHVSRTGSSTVASRYNVIRYLRHGGQLSAVRLQPGDVLYVPGSSVNGWETFMGVVSDLAMISSAVAFYVSLSNGN